MSEENIMARLHRLLSSADERDLDETECRCIRDAIFEIRTLRESLDTCEKLLNTYKQKPLIEINEKFEADNNNTLFKERKL